MISKVNRGDVFYYDFGYNYSTSVESKSRPALVISNNKGNSFGTTCLIAPITTRPCEKATDKPWQVYFKNGYRDQVILLEQIRCVSINKLGNYMGHLDAVTMHEVDIALCVELDLPISNQTIKESKMLSKMHNGMIINFNSKISKMDDFQKSISDEFDKYIKETKTLINNIKVDNTNTDFENSTSDNLSDIKAVLDSYNKNVTTLTNVLINMYDKLNKTEQNTISINTEDMREDSYEDCKNNVDIVSNVIKNETDKIDDEEKIEKHKSNTTIKNIKITSIPEMIEFLDYYMDHTYEEIEDKYHFNEKSASNRKLNYVKKLKEANIDVSKYLVRKKYSRKGEIVK